MKKVYKELAGVAGQFYLFIYHQQVRSCDLLCRIHLMTKHIHNMNIITLVQPALLVITMVNSI